MTSPRALVVAEAGVNHNGSLELARRLIDVAADAGADAVKFQTFKAERVVSRFTEKAKYQKDATNDGESQLDMVRRLELDEEAHHELIEHARKTGIGFLSTPFDEESVDLLAVKFGLETLKIPSGEITNGPLLVRIGRTKRRIILSTGMSTLGEIERALGAIAFGFQNTDEKPSQRAFMAAYAASYAVMAERVIILHCTTEYPAPYDEINLRAMDTLSAAFGLPVGLSDHSQGIAVAIGASARGAAVIEKHFTIDRGLPGPDHRASLEPGELKAMVEGIRQVQMSLGAGHKGPTPTEVKNLGAVRKSLVAAQRIRSGEILSAENMAIKRPGHGVSPMQYWDWIGRAAKRDYEPDELLD